jgi:hypothetical protein
MTAAEYVTFQKIVDADYEMPKGISQAAADLLRGLLQVEPANRIGECVCEGSEQFCTAMPVCC